ncbi:MAG: hypothetical protein ACKVTZ_18595 [Bacteroidia bacterium]
MGRFTPRKVSLKETPHYPFSIINSPLFMKHLFCLITLFFLLGANAAQAQIKMQKSVGTSTVQTQLPKVYMNATTKEWTEWVTDGIFQARCRVIVNSSTQKEFIQLQIISQEEGMSDFTANVCGDSPKGKNGWQRVKFYKNKPVTINIGKQDSCNNGWWWWFRNYKKAVLID